MARLFIGVALVATALAGCSTVMEANRPDPVDLTQFLPMEKRVEVISRIGAPETTVADGDDACDAYRLYTRGVSRVGKGAIILGEAAADVFTLGLSEVAFTPGEAATKNSRHSVLMCYGADNHLRSISDNGKVVLASGMPPSAPLNITPAPNLSH